MSAKTAQKNVALATVTPTKRGARVAEGRTTGRGAMRRSRMVGASSLFGVAGLLGGSWGGGGLCARRRDGERLRRTLQVRSDSPELG